MLYNDDFEQLPYGQRGYSLDKSWDATMLETGYVKSDKRFGCEADLYPRNHTAAVGREKRSYIVNRYIMPDTGDSATLDSSHQIKGKLRAASNSLSKIAVLWPRPGKGMAVGSYSGTTHTMPTIGEADGNCSTNLPHHTGANYLFCDGHVTFLNFYNYGGETGFRDEFCYPR
jgi:prepilin-type processing-associated H-X9-DG protein